MTTLRRTLFEAYKTTLVEIVEKHSDNWCLVEKALFEQMERGGTNIADYLNTTTFLRAIVDHCLDWEIFTNYIRNYALSEDAPEVEIKEWDLLDLIGKVCHQVEFL